jgi:hypothetical protein
VASTTEEENYIQQSEGCYDSYRMHFECGKRKTSRVPEEDE